MKFLTSMMFSGMVALTACSISFGQPSHGNRSHGGSHSGNRSGASHAHSHNGSHVNHASGAHRGSTPGHTGGYRAPAGGHTASSHRPTPSHTAGSHRPTPSHTAGSHKPTPGHSSKPHIPQTGGYRPPTSYAGPRISTPGPKYAPPKPGYANGGQRIIDTYYPPYGGSRTGNGGVIIVDRFDPPTTYTGTVNRYYPPYGGSRYGPGDILIVDRFAPVGAGCDLSSCSGVVCDGPVCNPADAVAVEPVQETQDEAASVPWQTNKFIEVKNTSAKNMKVRLVYCTEDKWLPEAADGNNVPLTYDINPGEQCRLSLASGEILASRIRIWVETEKGAWTEYRDKDLVLVDKAYQSENPLASVIQLGS